VGDAVGLVDGTAPGDVDEGLPAAEAVGEAEPLEGEWLATAVELPHAVRRAVLAISPSAETARSVRISTGTILCELSYVSGTILGLKQGSGPHPQGAARRGPKVRTASSCPFCFVQTRMEE
jgi:hypothetical protein